MIPTLQLSAAEHKNQTIQAETAEKAASLFRVKGCVLLENIFTSDFITTLHADYRQRYQHYFHEQTFEDALTVGVKRYKITVKLDSPFNSPLLYANPLLLPIIKRLLGERCILESFVNFTALAGSPEQQPHRDHPGLFETVIDRMVPSYAIKLIVPLVNMNEINGTTRLWPGSQIEFDEKALQIESANPHLALGDCMLMDYRLLHQGTANHSDQVRPVLFIGYARPWFRDSKNFKKQKRLKISRQTWQSIAPNHRHLFAWLKQGDEEDKTLRSG